MVTNAVSKGTGEMKMPTSKRLAQILSFVAAYLLSPLTIDCYYLRNSEKVKNFLKNLIEPRYNLLFLAFMI
jgi:hypothetical protein